MSRDFSLLYFLHDLVKAEVAEDEAGVRGVQGGNKPGPAATDLLSLAPGALQLAVGLGVVGEKLGIPLIRKSTSP